MYLNLLLINIIILFIGLCSKYVVITLFHSYNILCSSILSDVFVLGEGKILNFKKKTMIDSVDSSSVISIIYYIVIPGARPLKPPCYRDGYK